MQDLIRQPLDQKLAEIKDAWSKDTGAGRDEAARDLAKEYVEANADVFADLKGRTIEDLVESVETFRQAGFEKHQWLVEAYLLAEFPPQRIGAAINYALEVS